TWKAREYGLRSRLIELSGEVYASMPAYVISKLVDGLNDRSKSLQDWKGLGLRIAYKKNVDDMRESPSVQLMEILRDKGASVQYHDPYVPVFPKMREHKFDLSSIELTADSLGKFDVVLLATNHDDFDYKLILEHSRLV